MKRFGLDLRFPSPSDVPWAVLCGLLGAAVGAFLVHLTRGPSAVVVAMTIAGICVGVLAAAGANLDAGWRGAAVAMVGGLASFAVALVVLT
jgi:hypothetical protein